MDTRYQAFNNEISRFVDAQRIYTDPLRCLAWGTDAGFYRLMPKMVIRAKGRNEVSRLLESATRHNIPVTFRAAGTSLSGQAISDSVLIVAGKNWEKYQILEDGKAITLEPGIIGARVNEILAPLGYMFSPDPASKKSAMVGGIIINNASGMNCGTHANSDRVLRSMGIILADGTMLDTGDVRSRREFVQSHPEVLKEIESIRDDIRADKELAQLIAHKYSIKNVTGLNLLPFIMYDDPFDIMAHCMVGSEGTLGFMYSATCNTERVRPHAASAMLYFDDMAEACRCVVALKKQGLAESCEMLDKKSLASVNDTTGEGLTALLLDTKADTEAELKQKADAILETVHQFGLFNKDVQFTSDPAVYGPWWAIRSGIFPAVGGTRPLGTTVLIEDIAFHIDDLPKATTELAQLLIDCGYDDACIYGHAFEGNYHFIIAQSFDTQEEIDRYKHLMEEVERLVVDRYNGSLKAEHGTGRNMAPFVAKEWGDKAYGMMKRLKAAMDPQNLLNPGVIFNDDPECYIKNIKEMPMTNRFVDRCIECGFCEVNCVTCGFTLSARQRIVLQRELSRLRKEGRDAEAAALERAFEEPGVNSCAGDGLCSTSCPMHINTADLVHDLREARIPKGSLGYKVGKWSADHLGLISATMRPVLTLADAAHAVLGDKGVDRVGKALHHVGVPLWSAAMPGAAHKPHSVPVEGATKKVVYFPSCINRTMGESREHGHDVRPLTEVIVELCAKAGYEVIFPNKMGNLCCGMIWESKGMPDIADEKTAELHRALLAASDNGRIPVMCDQSPCLHRMKHHIKDLELMEPAEFIARHLVPELDFEPVDTPIAVHVTCSSRQMGLAETIIGLARRCSRNVTVPAEVGCCGFAGDKGFMLPELNKWALRKLRPQLQKAKVEAGYSNSRTCEIGLTTNSGIPYKSIAYLVNEVTKPKKK